MYIDKSIDNIIEDNMMGFAQYVIKNRALPDLYSGIKPIHLKILWSMYENKSFNLTKSATVSGKVMAYSPHGDCYDTIVNLVQKDRHINNLIIGQGNWGLYSSNDLQYAHARYTECKLSPLAIDCLEGISKHMVDMIDNYDNTRKMPKFLPTRFPLVLCMSHNGMAVGMADDNPSFNLEDVCNATIKYLLGEKIPILTPDFASGGNIINDTKELENINLTGEGKVKLRAKYLIEDNIINIIEIPYHKKVFVETIVDKIIELIKSGKLKEVTNVLNQTGLKGISIEIVCKKGINMNLIMDKLFKLTQLETTFSCNMNMLIDKEPKVIGVQDIIKEWSIFRNSCVTKGINYEINQLTNSLHLLYGLQKILLNIDKTIEIVRFSNKVEEDLIAEFSIDEIQAENIVNMKLKNINKDYIIKQSSKITEIENQIKQLKASLSDKGIKTIMIEDLKDVIKKFAQPRRTQIIEPTEIKQISQEELIEDYNCRVFYTNKYIKKHLKQSDNHKIVEGNTILGDFTTTNKSTLLIFTNKERRYRVQCSDLEQYQPSAHGTFVPKLLGFEDDEEVIKIVSVEKPTGFILVAYEDGNLAKIKIDKYLSSYKKLEKCYSNKSKVLDIYYSEKDVDILMVSDEGKAIIFNSNNFNAVGSTNSQGNVGMKLNEDGKVINAIVGINKEFNFELETLKGKKIELYLNDIAPTNKQNEGRDLYTYLFSKRGNMGNFLYNTRNTNGDKIVNLIKQ